MAGNDGNDRVLGGAGADELRGNNGNDDLRGGDGNDILNGGNGNDVISGGRGNDIAVFAGNMNEFSVRVLENGSLQLTGANGVDILRPDVERVQFTDRTVNFSQLLATARR